LSPLSVLVSKKDQRLYIRQGLAPVLNVPVTIRDRDTPLGTHVYIAARNDGPSLAWSVISLPSSAPIEEENTKRKRETDRNATARPGRPHSNAAEALERVEWPKDIGDRISERLWVGGSIVISDQPLSDETSDVGTDLVVTVR